MGAKPTFEAATPQALFDSHIAASNVIHQYDVTADGQRFLMVKDNDQKMYATKIVVVVNWVEELKRMMAEAAGKKL